MALKLLDLPNRTMLKNTFNEPEKSILLLYPIYIAVYIVAGGVLYYLYNFIMLIIALISISFYLAYVSNRDIKAVFSPENRFKHIPAILR